MRSSHRMYIRFLNVFERELHFRNRRSRRFDKIFVENEWMSLRRNCRWNVEQYESLQRWGDIYEEVVSCIDHELKSKWIGMFERISFSEKWNRTCVALVWRLWKSASISRISAWTMSRFVSQRNHWIARILDTGKEWNISPIEYLVRQLDIVFSVAETSVFHV